MCSALHARIESGIQEASKNGTSIGTNVAAAEVAANTLRAKDCYQGTDARLGGWILCCNNRSCIVEIKTH